MPACVECGAEYAVEGRDRYKRCEPHRLRFLTQRNRQQRVAELCRRHGLDVAAYWVLYQVQRGCCAICGEPEGPEPGLDERADPTTRLHIDHDHETGRIRGLLCYACNLALGGFRDTIELLERAADYLRRFSDAK